MEKPILLKPHALEPNATIGIFTPSSPAYIINPGLFENGLSNLQKMGFQIKLGSLTAKRAAQGYRSATPKERAEEFMQLIEDPKVDALLSTIGGNNSSSLIPYLNFDMIRQSRKVICGFSDVTSLHLAILHYANLQTFYSPTLMCWHGEWPDGIPESTEWFLQAVQKHRIGEREIQKPKRWSNHMRDWTNDDWKNKPREWQAQDGWKTLNEKSCTPSIEAPILALNLNTLMTAAGTPYFPELEGKILLLEDMESTMSRTERHLRQLQLMGVFEKISGLIVGKPEFFKSENAPFSYEDLILEVVGATKVPIVARFDCSHTVPMITVPQMAKVRLDVNHYTKFTFLEGSIED